MARTSDARAGCGCSARPCGGRQICIGQAEASCRVAMQSPSLGRPAPDALVLHEHDPGLLRGVGDPGGVLDRLVRGNSVVLGQRHQGSHWHAAGAAPTTAATSQRRTWQRGTSKPELPTSSSSTRSISTASGLRCGASHRIADSRRNPPQAVPDILDQLERNGVPQAVAMLRS